MSNTLARRVEPEWLDALPAHDARAQRSRRDLVRINALMGNAGFVADALKSRSRPPFHTIAEIGAGDGAFLLRTARALGPRDTAAFLVDRQNLLAAPTRDALAALRWQAQPVQADVFDWLESAPPVDAIVANLFLHHFEPARLATMLALVAARTRLFVACEPRRSAFALAGAHLLGFIGCNDVSRHDAVVSVRAGFRDAEISSLWPQAPGWSLQERARGAFSHLFVAVRSAP